MKRGASAKPNDARYWWPPLEVVVASCSQAVLLADCWTVELLEVGRNGWMWMQALGRLLSALSVAKINSKHTQ